MRVVNEIHSNVSVCVCVHPRIPIGRISEGKVANDCWVYKAERASNSRLASVGDKLVAARRISLQAACHCLVFANTLPLKTTQSSSNDVNFLFQKFTCRFGVKPEKPAALPKRKAT